jgi:hypothetical protein
VNLQVVLALTVAPLQEMQNHKLEVVEEFFSLCKISLSGGISEDSILYLRIDNFE